MAYSRKQKRIPSGTPPPPKRKKSRLFLKLTVVLAGLFVLFLILILTLDLNTFRKPIAEAIYQATGTKVEFDFIELEFSQGLQIKCHGVQILPPELQERRFATVATKELWINIELLPLLQRQVAIESITLTGPVLKFSIAPPSQEDTLPPSEKPSPDLIPAPDPSEETKSPDSVGVPEWLQNIRQFLRESKNVTLDEINLVAGQVILQDEETGKEAVLSAGARMEINRVENRVGFVIDDIELAMGNIRAQAEIRIDNIIPTNASVQADIQIEPFEMSDLLPLLDWVPGGQGIINEQISLKGKSRKIHLNFETPLDAMSNLESIIKYANADLTLNTQEVSLVQFGKTLSSQSFDVAIQWKDRQMEHKIVLNALGGNFKTEGKLFRAQGSKSAQDWTLDSHVILDEINMVELKNIIPQQAAWFPRQGTLTGKVHLQGPVMRPETMKGKGNFKVTNLVVKVKDAPMTVPVTEFEGELNNGQLVHDLNLKIFGGNLQVKGNLKMNKTPKGEWDPVINSDVISQSIQLASLPPLAQKDLLPKQGTLSGKIHLQGPVMRPETMKGKGNFKVTNLVVKVKDAHMIVPVTEFEGKLNNGQLVHDLNLEIFGGNLQVKGQLKMNKNRKGEWDPVIDSVVVPQSIQLTSLPPLVEKDLLPKQGTLSGRIHVRGPVARLETMKGNGNIKILNLEVKVKGAPVAVAVTEFKGKWANNRLVHDLKLKIFGGNLQVKGLLKMNKNRKGEWDPVIDSDVIPQSIQLTSLPPLVEKDLLPQQGTLSGKIHLQGPVTRPETMKGKGNLKVKNLKVQVKDIPVAVAVTEFEGEWANNRLVHDLKLEILDGSLQVKGQLKMNKTPKGEWDPVIDSDVILQSIQLASLPPLVQEEFRPKQGILSGKVHLQGPVTRIPEIKPSGVLTGKRFYLKSKEKRVVLDTILLSFKPKTRESYLIDFSLSDLFIDKIRVKKSTAKMVVSKSSVELKQGKIWPKASVLLLNGVYKFETRDYHLDISGKELRLEHFRPEQTEGPLDLKGSFNGRVLPEKPLRGLSGNFEFHSKNGRIVKASNVTTKILAALNFKLPSRKSTLPFDSLGGSFAIKKGVLSTQDFEINGPSIWVQASGEADLADETINVEVAVVPLQYADEVLDGINSLIRKSQAGDNDRGMLSRTIKKVPIIGGDLTGDEEKEGLLDGVYKMVPLLGDKRKEGDKSKGLIKTYFLVEGTFKEPKISFLPGKTLWF